MGGGIVRRLLASGHSVGTYDPSESAKTEMIEVGAEVYDRIADAISGRELVILSLPSDRFVTDVLAGEGGVFTHADRATTIIDASTISPMTAREVGAQARSRGLSYIDAPITVSQMQPQRPDAEGLEPNASAARRAAASGNLGFFVGGGAAEIDLVADVLADLGLETHRVGPTGSGMTVKLFNNAIAMSQVALVSEMLVVAEREGMHLDAVVEALSHSSSNSSILHSHIRPFSLKHSFPAKLFPVTYAVKDLSLARDVAIASGFDARILSAALADYEATRNAGYVDDYFPSVIEGLRKSVKNAEDGND